METNDLRVWRPCTGGISVIEMALGHSARAFSRRTQQKNVLPERLSVGQRGIEMTKPAASSRKEAG